MKSQKVRYTDFFEAFVSAQKTHLIKLITCIILNSVFYYSSVHSPINIYCTRLILLLTIINYNYHKA